MDIRQRDSLRLSTAALWLILPPLAVFAAGDLLQEWIGWWRELAPPTKIGASMRAEAAGRLTMMAAFLAAVTVGVGAVFICLGDLLRLFGSTVRYQLLAASVAAILILVAWVAVTGLFLPGIIDYPGMGFIKSALERAETDLSEKLITINWIVRVVFVLAAVSVIVATISCLAEPVRSRPPWARRALRRLQQRRLRRYLNLAAATMTVGLLFMVAWMRWAGFVYSGEAHAAYVMHVNALALYFGVYYSAMIASYYVPIAVILQMREASALLGRDSPRAEDGLVGSRSAEAAGKGLAVLVPAIAGVAPSLLELLRASVGG